MNIQSALSKLFSLHQFGIKLGLDNILNLLEQIGNPHQKLKTFHIAGSNGKGSTASFIASILMEAGYKVGLYTSPHFRIYNERIRINGKMINDEYVADFVTMLEEYIQKNSLTFFEITTALAFKYFYEQNVDYAVIETGLGGRLDATNVISPIGSVVTSISLEHTQYLGNTLEKIAEEKAGIIKPNSNVFIGRMPEETKKVFERTALQCASNFFPIDDYLKSEKERVIIRIKERPFSLYTTPLQGEHQLINAALAIKTLDETIDLNNGIILSKGIKNVVSNSGIEGRYEIVCPRPRIIFDSAHNIEGVTSFIKEFSKEFLEYSERILIFGAMRDKSIGEMLLALNPYFTAVYVAEIDIERSSTLEELNTIASSMGIEVNSLKDPVSLVNDFFGKTQNHCLVVLGSMYLLGQIKYQMFNKKA